MNRESFSQVVKYFENPILQFTTFTITEKGYGLHDLTGSLFSAVEVNIKNSSDKSQHIVSIVIALLEKRFLGGELPIAIISTNNFLQRG